MKTSAMGAAILVAFLAGLLSACGGNQGGQTPLVEKYVPLDAEVGDWVEDTANLNNEPGVQVAYNAEDGEALINGHIFPFTDTGGWVAMAMEYYVSQADDSRKLELSLHEMQEPGDAQAAYEDSRLHGNAPEWETVSSVADFCRVYPGGAYWMLHAIQHNYFIEIWTFPEDPSTRGLTEAFATALAAKLP